MASHPVRRKVPSEAGTTDSRRLAAQGHRYCSMPVTPEPILPAGIVAERARAILETANKWVNGTVVHYYFFDKPSDGEDVLFSDGTKEWRSWRGAEKQKKVVREAFRKWKEVGIGLEFKEVSERDDAEVRIGFMTDDGSW